jgi:hypothetical protein
VDVKQPARRVRGIHPEADRTLAKNCHRAHQRDDRKSHRFDFDAFPEALSAIGIQLSAGAC